MQATEYPYADAVDANWPTLVKYPDGNTTAGGGGNNVQYAYHTDGAVSTRQDQRGTTLQFAYDPLRRPQAMQVTADGTADPAVQSITRGYDELGRLVKVTSHANDATLPTDETNVLNQVVFTYDDLHRATKGEQAHDGIVGTGTPAVQ